MREKGILAAINGRYFAYSLRLEGQTGKAALAAVCGGARAGPALVTCGECQAEGILAKAVERGLHRTCEHMLHGPALAFTHRYGFASRLKVAVRGALTFAAVFMSMLEKFSTGGGCPPNSVSA